MSSGILFSICKIEGVFMIITTAGRTNNELNQQAIKIANQLGAVYHPRRKQSVAGLQSHTSDDCIVVGKDRLELYPLGEEQPFFFHPNSAMFRIKRLMRGEHDPFVEATGLKAGMSYLDCTLGLASDSIVASFIIGDAGKATGIEANRYLAYIVAAGLKKWESGLEEMDAAMRNINVLNANSKSFLSNFNDNSFDVVYLDPMFEEPILESDGIKALSRFASYEDLDEEIIYNALRVANKRVVLKDHYKSERFERYGFKVFKRKTAKFHFGVLEKK